MAQRTQEVPRPVSASDADPINDAGDAAWEHSMFESLDGVLKQRDDIPKDTRRGPAPPAAVSPPAPAPVVATTATPEPVVTPQPVAPPPPVETARSVPPVESAPTPSAVEIFATEPSERPEAPASDSAGIEPAPIPIFREAPAAAPAPKPLGEVTPISRQIYPVVAVEQPHVPPRVENRAPVVGATAPAVDAARFESRPAASGVTPAERSDLFSAGDRPSEGWASEILRGERTYARTTNVPEYGYRRAAQSASPPVGDFGGEAIDSQRGVRLPPAMTSWINPQTVVIAVLGTIALVEMGVIARRPREAPAATVTSGSLVISSHPAGADILIDGAVRGKTPAALTVPPGQHKVEVREGDKSQILPIDITAGAQISHDFVLETAVQPGSIRVQSKAGDQVVVDGTNRGRAPLVVSGLTPGPHVVEIKSGNQTIQQAVEVQSGIVASVVVAAGATPASAPAGPSSGWLAITVPAEVDLFEGDRLVGNSRSDRILLPAGRHDLNIVNESLGIRVRRVVQIDPGKTASLRIDLPPGKVNINAVPWAEVSIDGKSIGQTPLANVSIPAGQHEFVFRHPQLGERKTTVSVASNVVTRVSADFSK